MGSSTNSNDRRRCRERARCLKSTRTPTAAPSRPTHPVRVPHERVRVCDGNGPDSTYHLARSLSLSLSLSHRAHTHFPPSRPVCALYDLLCRRGNCRAWRRPALRPAHSPCRHWPKCPRPAQWARGKAAEGTHREQKSAPNRGQVRIGADGRGCAVLYRTCSWFWRMTRFDWPKTDSRVRISSISAEEARRPVLCSKKKQKQETQPN